MNGELHILGGIDEAGLGPLLGPLVIGGLVLAGPAGGSPWQQLQMSFCRRPRSRRDRRIRVDDSKRVKQGNRGLGELERTALTFLHAAAGRLPATLADLLGSALDPEDLGPYPWYADIGTTPLPRWNDGPSLELDIHVAQRALAAAGIRCIAFLFRLVDVRRWNDLIRLHDNKHLAHLEGTLAVLAACLRAVGDARQGNLAGAPCTLVVDRQGGREHYRDVLQRAFPDQRVAILGEGSRGSRYRLGDIEVLFTERGETRAFPTAAASCLAKYVRELCIERLNAWFCRRQPGLRPTAGYYTDGRRFLDDLEDRAGIPVDCLVRIR